MVRRSEPFARDSRVVIGVKTPPPPVPIWHMVQVLATSIVALQPRLCLPTALREKPKKPSREVIEEANFTPSARLRVKEIYLRKRGGKPLL